MEVVGILIACVGVGLGASAPFFLRRRFFLLGNLASILGALCNVAATQFAPQSEIQPLAGLMVPLTVLFDSLLTKKNARPTKKFWGACFLVVGGDASIVAWSPPLRTRTNPNDANVLWMILVGAALASLFLLTESKHWAMHGLKPGLLSGFAITSVNAFLACVFSPNQHQHVLLYGIFALGLSLLQIILVNQAAALNVPEVDFQSVYVSSIIVSGTLVGLFCLEETLTFWRGAWLFLALLSVVVGAYVVPKEHAALSQTVTV